MKRIPDFSRFTKPRYEPSAKPAVQIPHLMRLTFACGHEVAIKTEVYSEAGRERLRREAAERGRGQCYYPTARTEQMRRDDEYRLWWERQQRAREGA